MSEKDRVNEFVSDYGIHNPPPGSTLTSASQYTQSQRDAAQYMNPADAGGESPPLHVIPVDLDSKVAFKDDSKKTDLSLLPYRPLAEIAKVLEFGAKKYDRNNWRKGFAHERLVAAMLRHLFAYNEGETNDPETGLCHLAHLGCMLLFLMETRHTHPELDYRGVHETQ